MRRVAYVLKDDGSCVEQDVDSPNLHGVQHNLSGAAAQTIGELGTDAKNLGSALASFPYGSALKVIGFLTILYIGFKLTNKFVNIGDKVKHLLRSK